MKVKYSVMASEIMKRGIRKTAIAKAISSSTKTLNNKLCGKSEFTWNEVCTIQAGFLPDISKDDLMATDEQKSELNQKLDESIKKATELMELLQQLGITPLLKINTPYNNANRVRGAKITRRN